MTDTRSPTHREVRFPGGTGDLLVGTLDLPTAGAVRATAVFAHCFTCSRESHAAARISTALAAQGIAVLRFDFTGLGSSGGDFTASTFTSNLDDLEAAAAWLSEHHGGPDLLVGHSLGGAAVIAVSERLPTVRAVAVVGAPASPTHVEHVLDPVVPADDGHLEVTIGGRVLHVGRQLLADLAEQPQQQRIAALRRPLLVLHSPLDEVVGIDQARQVFDTARHPKSFVALDGADHLLRRRSDSEFAAAMIATWSQRFVADTAPPSSSTPTTPPAPGVVLVEELSDTDGFAHLATTAGPHQWRLDEPPSVGGADSGANPYELVLSALGACTSMTMRMYARRKGWDYGTTQVTLRHERIHAHDCASCVTEDGYVDWLHREIRLDPALPPDQRAALLAIADKCPVHRTLTNEVEVATTTTP